MKKKYDVFISCKSEDYVYAEEVYNFLNSNGIYTFLASKELRKMGDSEYRNAIMQALDSAYHLIIFASKPEYVESKWVFYEWDTFVNAKLNGRKDGQIMTILKGVETSALRLDLIKYESFSFESYKERLLPYVESPETQRGKEEHTQQDDAEIFIETDMDCHVQRFHRNLIIAHVGRENIIHLPKGRHKLQFIAIVDETISKEMIFDVQDVKTSDFIEVELLVESNKKNNESLGDSLVLDKLVLVPKENSNGKWGYVDKLDFLIIPYKYDYASEFHRGLASVKRGNKWGFIDKEDNVIIPIEYDQSFADAFEDDDWTALSKNDKWGFVDTKGNIKIPFKYEDSDLFEEGLASVKLNGKYGFINRDGNTVIPFVYDGTGCFHNGITAVEKKEKWGVINKENKIIIPMEFDYVDASLGELSGGIIEVKKSNFYGCLDMNGNIVIPIEYDVIGPFFDNMAEVKKNNKEGIINNKGDLIIPLVYDYVDNFREDLAVVCKNKKWGFVDKNNKIIIPIEYDYAYWFENGHAKVRIGNEWLLIDKAGKPV